MSQRYEAKQAAAPSASLDTLMRHSRNSRMSEFQQWLKQRGVDTVRVP